MKRFTGFLLILTFIAAFSSCYNTSLKKPEKLIPKDKFIKMMVDVYLVQAINSGVDTPELLKKVTETDLYFSVLKKYDVPDTVFVHSLIYYSSFPKEYEKMHTQIMNILNESEQKFRPKEELNTEAQ